MSSIQPLREAAPLEIRLLGPLDVNKGGESISLGGARPRALLALLCLQRGVISRDRLVDELWGESPPATAGHMVEVYVSKLRGVLGAETLVTRSRGYFVDVDPQQIDIARFESLVLEGVEALAADNVGEAATRLAQGLALWRGPALADFTYEPFAQGEIARLDELRLRAEEGRIDAELALGKAPDLVGELERLVAGAPYRERFHAQLMLALYRSGRQADALEAYRRARETLVKELGVEPGKELRKLERAMLAQEEWLGGGHATGAQVFTPARRKVVTVLIAEFAAGGPKADLEAHQPLAERSLESAEHVLERHGAAVERLPDGTLMGIFGSPRAHEDDALRSLRTVVDLRQMGLAFRAAVDTGEVLANSRAKVSGPPVRAAAELLVAASPGEVLVGEATRRVAAHAARFEALVSNGATSWRLLEVLPDAPTRPRGTDVVLVGREKELAALRCEFSKAVRDGRPRLVMVIGEAGIGKSRIARALTEELGHKARVAAGHCLAYGDGVTYWPLREVIGALALGGTAEALARLVEGADDEDQVRRRLAAAVGLSHEAYPVEEIQWAARKLFEKLAAKCPLVLVIEDVHWAEPTFLDLLEHVVKVGEGAPILVLCMARPDLLDRPRNPDRLDGGVRLVLEGLTTVESAELASRLDSGALSPDQRERVIALAEGNPLFLEQLIALGLEGSPIGDAVDLPPTMRAVLAARLDRLGPGEQAVLHSAAVVGREFSLSAVTELLPADAVTALARHLHALTSKGLIETTQTGRPFDETHRFRHVLLQEAAYRSLPKAERARLHERLGLWLAERPRPADDELIGHHLEQAYRHRAELGPVDEHCLALARQAAERLTVAAERALGREDWPAQANFLVRARSLLPPGDSLRLELLPALGLTLVRMGEFAQATEVIREAIDSDDERVGARAIQARLEAAVSGTSSRDYSETLQEAEHAIEVLEESGDDLDLAKAWDGLAMLRHSLGQEVLAQEACERAIEHARRAGGWREEMSVLRRLAFALTWGPTHRSDALRRCQEILEEVAGFAEFEGDVLAALAILRALEGSFDEARALCSRRDELLNERGFDFQLAWGSHFSGWVEMLADDPEAAEAILRPAFEALSGMRAAGEVMNIGAHLAEALYMQGRYQEAESLAASIEPLDPNATVELWYARGARAKSIGRLGRLDEAERLAREAVMLADQADYPIDRADARMCLAEVLRLCGRLGDAAEVVREASRYYEQKGNLVSGGRARALLEVLGS